jgi:hypothetical protein
VFNLNQYVNQQMSTAQSSKQSQDNRMVFKSSKKLQFLKMGAEEKEEGAEQASPDFHSISSFTSNGKFNKGNTKREPSIGCETVDEEMNEEDQSECNNSM